jgi:hypothetical protein
MSNVVPEGHRRHAEQGMCDIAHGVVDVEDDVRPSAS